MRLAQPGLRCGDCLSAPRPFERAICAVDYRPPWDHLITAYKYQQRVELATLLADRLHAALDDAALDWAQCVVPVPLSTARLRERGYNQAWELARRVAASARLPAFSGTLTRPRDTAPQAGLSRNERQRNLTHAFQVARPQGVAGKRVVLVDDVLTTGATAAAASRSLLAAGASAVQVWALARTP